MASKAKNGRIAANRRARRDYEILEELDAGLVLLGWEVKALRAGRASLVEAYVVIRGGEAWLVGANFAPLPSASVHPAPVAARSRKLLMHRRQLDRLAGKVQQRGLTLVPLALFWGGSKAKLRVGLGTRPQAVRQAASGSGTRLEPRETAAFPPRGQGALARC